VALAFIFRVYVYSCAAVHLLQRLECITFSRDGREFMSSHSDGSYIIWTTDEPNFPKEPATTPYGDFHHHHQSCVANEGHRVAPT